MINEMVYKELPIDRKSILRAEESKELERRVKAKTATVRERQRAQMVLLVSEGRKQAQIAASVGISRVTVSHRCRRFPAQGIDGLAEAPGHGRKPTVPSDKIRRVLEEGAHPPKYLKASHRTITALWNAIGTLLDASHQPHAKTTSHPPGIMHDSIENALKMRGFEFCQSIG